MVPPYLQKNPGEKFVGRAGRTRGGGRGALTPGIWVIATRDEGIELVPLNPYQGVQGCFGFLGRHGSAPGRFNSLK